MRVNIYAEEMTERIQIISKEIEGQVFTGLRFYLELPVSFRTRIDESGPFPLTAANQISHGQLKGPFIHHKGDDDSAAVTFWGKRDLRAVLLTALKALDAHYAEQGGSHAE